MKRNKGSKALRQQSATIRDSDAAAPAPKRLAVTRLTVTGFRSYARVRLETGGRSVVLFGDNGVGKTNLLEAVSLLTPGRGLRSAKPGDLGRRPFGAETGGPWGVAASIEGRDGPADIGTGVETAPDGQALKRLVKINGERRRAQSDLADHLSVLWLVPQMDRLFLEGPAARRKFLDRMVYAFDPAHAGRVTAYETAMRERARLLTAGCADRAWLAALEDTMAGRGVAVAAARLELVRALDAYAAEPVGPFPFARLWIDGAVERDLGEGTALDAEDRLKEALLRSRERDAETGGASFGPHRADLRVRHGPKGQGAALCSTGEQKALLIALVLANARLLAAERNCRPVLLLDEIAAHLDENRRGALFDLLMDLDAQAWFTGTEAGPFEALSGFATHFRVESGAATLLPETVES